MDQALSPQIIFEDVDILVLDKPAGIIVNRSETTIHESTLQDWIENHLQIQSTKPGSSRYPAKHEIGNKFEIQNQNDQNGIEFRNPEVEFLNRSGIVHRLDKETSGILLVAKNPRAFIHLQAQFKERVVKKTYRALVHGKVVPGEGEIRIPVGRLPWNRKQFGIVAGGREAVTRYTTITNYQKKNAHEKMSLLELYPETGRTHQIRVHMKYLNYPIVSDYLYAGRKTAIQDRKHLGRVFLHAARISFRHPTTGEEMKFESKLPGELEGFIRDYLQEM